MTGPRLFQLRSDMAEALTAPASSGTVHRRTVLTELTRGKDGAITVSVSSEMPVDRGGYCEVLDHGPSAVDLRRAREGLPLLLEHDREKHIGRASNIRLENRKLKAELRPGRTEIAAEVWKDLEGGTRKEVSIGYHIIEARQDADGTIRAIKWEPLEFSIVAIPADYTVGVGRSFGGAEGSTLMTIETHAPAAPAAGVVEPGAERREIGDILAMGERYGMTAEAARHVREGRTLDQFRTRALDELARRADPSLGPPVGSGGYPASGALVEEFGRRSDLERFSMLRVVRALADPRNADAGYEREVSQELARQLNRRTRGFFVPLGVLGQRTITIGGSGGNLVGTDHMGGSFIDVLRARSHVMSLGPTVLSGLVGNVSIPKKSAAATAYWIAGDGADGLTPSDPTFGEVPLEPHTVGGLTKISHKTLVQSDPGVEQLVRMDLADTIASAIDLAAIQGTGLSNQPTGILSTSGIGAETYAMAGTPTFANIVALEGDLAASSADRGSLAYLANSTLAMALKTVSKVSGDVGAGFIWENGAMPGEGRMNGYPARHTANVPAGTILFGNWADLLIGMWGVVEITANPFEDFAKGTISVRALADVDIGVRHAQSFCSLTEATGT